jgi:glycosyltransferase involved in cell wall biosynthesis
MESSLMIAPVEGPSLSVVIPALNEERHVGSLLSDLLSQTRKADEVIVVDAGSEDGTVSVVERFPGVIC